MHCVDAETGRPYWTHEVKGQVWASPLLADGKVYFATCGGEVLVFAASKEKKILSETNLGAAVYGTPIVANGVIYVQSNTHLFAFRAATK